MKTLKTLSAIFLVATAFAAQSALAQTAPSTNTTGTNMAKPRAASTQYRGTVGSVDTATMTITLKATTRSPETKVKVTSTTKIKKGTEAAQLSDVAVGARISGAGKKGDDGVWTATTLNIAAAKTAPTPAPAVKE